MLLSCSAVGALFPTNDAPPADCMSPGLDGDPATGFVVAPTLGQPIDYRITINHEL